MNKLFCIGALFSWSLVLAAAKPNENDRKSAFTRLSGCSWPPPRLYPASIQSELTSEGRQAILQSSTGVPEHVESSNSRVLPTPKASVFFPTDDYSAQFHGITERQIYCQNKTETNEAWKRLLVAARYTQEEISSFWSSSIKQSVLASTHLVSNSAPAAQAQETVSTSILISRLFAAQISGNRLDLAQLEDLIRRKEEIENTCKVIDEFNKRAIIFERVMKGDFYLKPEELFDRHLPVGEANRRYKRCYVAPDIPLDQIDLFREHEDILWCFNCLNKNDQDPVTTVLNPVITQICITERQELKGLQRSVQIRSSLHRLRKIFHRAHANNQPNFRLKFTNKKELGLARVEELTSLQKKDLELLDLELLKVLLIKYSDGIELRYSDDQIVTISYDPAKNEFTYSVRK